MLRCVSPVVFLATFLLAGCSSYDPASLKAKTAPARGKVTLADGTPLRGGKVTLHPKDKTKPEAQAIVQKDGTFVLMTYVKDDGAAPGSHRVTVERLYYDKNGNLKKDNALPIPKRYWSEDTSDLTAEIGDQPNDLKFQLKGS